MIRISSDIDCRRHLHYGMLGMVLMAYLSTENVGDILKATNFYEIFLLGICLEKMSRIFSFGMGSHFRYKGTNTMRGLIALAPSFRNISRKPQQMVRGVDL